MTPERWRQVDELFDAAVRLEPEARASWLSGACGGDEPLRAEVARLLAEDELAARDGFMTPPEPVVPPPDPTGAWPPRDDRPPRRVIGPIDHDAADLTGDFAQKAAITAGSRPHPNTEARSVLRSRLCELAMVYLLIFGMSFAWRHFVRRRFDLSLSLLHVVVLAVLGGIVLRLLGKRPLSLARLRALELAMIALLAGRVAIAQYWQMLGHSLRNDPMSAQRTLQNHVLLTAILILTSGIYVPKGWRRAALMAVPLALLPFATLLVLALRHPEAMTWLVVKRPLSGFTPLGSYGYDAMLLLIVALVSAWGAKTIYRLRMQVDEARQLGQYRLRERIGAGGMGEVYLADHQLLKRPCAIKLIRPDDAADPEALERFEREVRITATLSHWNTVEIFDYGRTEEGTYYYVMEYLPGLSLADLVERHGPLPPERAIFLLRQVCLALGEAHAAGLIHRDIKPSNIFAAHRGGMDDVAKLLDFGLVLAVAKAPAPEPGGSAPILGTPLFMSPEQARGGAELDERSDIYSVGTVAYFLLTGRPPFDAGSAIEVMIAHGRNPVVPPSQLRAEVPEDLERVVLRCLAKDPARRYRDSASLEQALGECACARGWDQARAARWWQEAARGPKAAGSV